MQFPPPYRAKERHKTLAYLDGGQIVTEEGEKRRGETWGDIQSCLDSDCTILSPTLVGCDWWDSGLQAGGKPSFSQKLGITGLRCPYTTDSRRKGWLVRGDTWGGMENDKTADGRNLPGSLQPIRNCLDSLRCGDCHTPSSLGLATMVKWWNEREPKFYRPAPSIERALREGLIGGRVDTLREKETFKEVWEYDINNAYASAAQRLPAGGAFYVRALRPGLACYAYCHVRGRTDGTISPLGVRTHTLVDYPRSGDWHGWYWSDEIDAGREAGFRVDVEYGFCWPEWSYGLAGWAGRIHRLRSSAPEECRGIIKLVTVAAIGRFLSHSAVKLLTSEITDTPYFDDTGSLDPSGSPWPYYIYERELARCELQPQIGSYINAQIRLATYRKALAEGDALIATNYDAVVSLRPPSEPISAELGAWKHYPLHNAEVPYPRAIRSEEKTRLPGLPYAARAA